VKRAHLLAAAPALWLAACGASSDTSAAFETRLPAIASQAGLDVAAWQACRIDPAVAARVDADLALGRVLGIPGTPAFLVNGSLLVGSQPAATFRGAIDAARNRAQASGLPAARYYDAVVPDVPVGTSPVAGPADAWVTVVEFSDFECPYCGAVQETLASVLPAYGNDVRHVFKHYPLSFHPFARRTAIAAECAHAQGLFWPFEGLVFGGQSALFAGP
jgi:protein-disulfide isomerase